MNRRTSPSPEPHRPLTDRRQPEPSARGICGPALALLLTGLMPACVHDLDADETQSNDGQRSNQQAPPDTSADAGRVAPFPAWPAPDTGFVTLDADAASNLDATTRIDAAQPPTADAGNIADGEHDSVHDDDSNAAPADDAAQPEHAICPTNAATAVTECVLSTATDGPETGDWTHALAACTAPSVLSALLDDACAAGDESTICQSPAHERPASWLRHCRSGVENAIRDELCVLDGTWSMTELSGRVVTVRERRWARPQDVPAAVRARAAGRDARLRSDDWDATWRQADIAYIVHAEHIDLTRVSTFESILVADSRATIGAVYQQGSLAPFARLDEDVVTACTLGEGDNMRPCRTDLDCRPGHRCRAGGDTVGRCIRMDQAVASPGASPSPCVGHEDCGPPSTLCATGAQICIPASSRQTVTSWGGFSEDEADHIAVAADVLVYGGSGHAAGAALRLHLRAPLTFDASVELIAPDGTVFVVPWATDWSHWVPLPHVSDVPDNGLWQLVIRDDTGSNGAGFDGWSLRVDSL